MISNNIYPRYAWYEINWRFHNALFDILQGFDSKYGRWLPKNCYNIDQVPLPFVIDQDETYDLTGNTQVWVSQPSTGLDKRQATFQLCIRAELDLFLRVCLGGQRDKHAMGFKDSYTWHREIDCRESDPFADNVGFQQNKDFHETCRRNLML